MRWIIDKGWNEIKVIYVKHVKETIVGKGKIVIEEVEEEKEKGEEEKIEIGKYKTEQLY